MSIYCVCQTMHSCEDREIVFVFKRFTKVKDLEANTRCTVEGLLETESRGKCMQKQRGEGSTLPGME